MVNVNQTWEVDSRCDHQRQEVCKECREAFNVLFSSEEDFFFADGWQHILPQGLLLFGFEQLLQLTARGAALIAKENLLINHVVFELLFLHGDGGCFPPRILAIDEHFAR